VDRPAGVILPTLTGVRIPFSSSERSSLGVEWELQLVDRESRELSAGAVEVLEEIRPDGEDEHPKAKHELLQSTVEVITGVCTTVGEATADLAATVAEVAAAADRRGLGLLCAGTHPFTDWQTQLISPKERYLQLVERMQWMARRLQIFGVHVHVGVRAPDKAMPIVNALTQYVPHFLALSASSPFWVGCDTGLASARSKVFEGMPTAGLPMQLPDWPGFEQYMETLISTGAIESVREVWWDIRPHPGFGTVELRICDGLPTLEEVGVVAAFSQCLVEQLDGQLDRGYTLPTPPEWVLRENKWRAARYGLDADVIVDEKGTVRPVRQALLDLAEDLTPTARRLGCEDELAGVERVLAVGASYQRQRAAARSSGGDLRAVVDGLLSELRDGLPAAGPAAGPDGPVPGPSACAGGHAA
jgi:carboxylate-amine ligase